MLMLIPSLDSHSNHHHAPVNRNRTSQETLASPLQKLIWPRVTLESGLAPISRPRPRGREMGRIMGARPCQRWIVQFSPSSTLLTSLRVDLIDTRIVAVDADSTVEDACDASFAPRLP